MKKGWIVVAGIAAFLLISVFIAAGWFISTRNDLIARDTQVQSAWSQVENQFQRRLDLIPNLMETVKGLAAQERGIIQDIANARARIQGARDPQSRIGAENELSSALSRLLVIVENYPQIKSDQGFLRLMDELAGTENRLAVERKRYNDAVQAYNLAVRQFPSSVVASSSGFQQKPFFEAPAAARQAPQVKFQ
ncbi:MAG TPA: LemA family protein [Candidatus Sulfotelmatobacter sp.]|nr:LemA family protein [Candidatus Sulfotelmatobacter sp.]